MMTAEDNLLRTFDTVYKAAVAARNAGRYNKAKRDFYQAAELMTELAKMSGDKLKAARVDRAKRIIAIADGCRNPIPSSRNSAAAGKASMTTFAAISFARPKFPIRRSTTL